MNEKKKEKNITNAKAEINITEKIQITENKDKKLILKLFKNWQYLEQRTKKERKHKLLTQGIKILLYIIQTLKNNEIMRKTLCQ